MPKLKERPTYRTKADANNRARTAVAEFRKMQPTLTAFARAITGNPQVRIQVSAGIPRTDGKVIYYPPAIELGDRIPHDTALCDRRDPDTYKQLCAACAVREHVYILIYHEIAHIAFGSFLEPEAAHVTEAMRYVRAIASPKYAERINQRLLNAPTIAKDYLNLAQIINPYFKQLVNCLEDVRINYRMQVARPGTIDMMAAWLRKVMFEGSEAPDGSRVFWSEMHPNHQASIGVYCVASGLGDLDGLLSDEVVRAMADPKLHSLALSVPACADAHEAFQVSWDVFMRLRELGFYQLQEEADDDAAEQNDTDDQGGVPTPPPVPTPPQPGGSGGGSTPPAPEERDDEDADDADEGDDSSGADSSSDEDESGESSAPESDPVPDSSGAGAGEDGDEDTDSSAAAGDENVEPSDDEAAPGAGAVDDDDSDDDTPESGDAGSVEADADADGDDTDSDDEGDEGLEVGDPADGDDDFEDGEAFRVEPDEAAEEDIDLEGLGLHVHKTETTGTEEHAIEVAIVQGQYFEKPSDIIDGVNEWFYENTASDSHDRHWHAWKPNESRSERRYEGMLMEPVPETILAPALMRLRRVFSDNKRTRNDRNRKSGKLDARVLGRRAWNDDERLFGKKVVPGKKDYFVIIGLDISGSTRGRNLKLIKEAAQAKADLLARLGIPFAVYAHTGSPRSQSGAGNQWVDIYHIKDANQPWDDKARQRLADIASSYANLDGHTLEFYRRELDKSTATDRILLYYTDGKMPAANFVEELDILQREIKTCTQKGYTLLGVGIRTDSPRDHGLDTVEVNDSSDIIRVVEHLERRLAV